MRYTPYVILIIFSLGCISQNAPEAIISASTDNPTPPLEANTSQPSLISTKPLLSPNDRCVGASDVYTCFVGEAYAENNASICNPLPYPENEFCTRDVSVGLGEPAFCLNLENTSLRDECIYYSSVFAAYHGFCRQMSTKQLEDSCISSVAAVLGNPDLCRLITQPSSFDLCLTGVFAAVDSKTACVDIGDGQRRIKCFHDVAYTHGRINFCDHITIQGTKDDCISDTAYAIQNETLCDKMIDKTKKDICIRNILRESE